jgi:GH18 family chitinase
MKTFSEKLQKPLLRKFHTLCSNLGLDKETRHEMIAPYGVESSADLTAKDLIDLCNKLERIGNAQFTETDKWRNRLIASIGGWLKALGKRDDAKTAKAIACRAAGKKSFYDIPLERLRSLYYAFTDKQKDLRTVRELTADELDILAYMN